MERSEKNPGLIEEMQKLDCMPNWKSPTNTSYFLRKIDKDSLEYRRVQNAFQMTARSIKITEVKRVENPYLLGIYLLKKMKIEKQYGTVSEKTLFHGTRKRNIDDICTNNFDWRLSGSSRGHKFGMGVSFTPHVSYAQHYGCKVIIISKVLVRRKIIGNMWTEIPPTSYDTTTNEQNTVLVKYEDDDFYPQYVIHYS